MKKVFSIICVLAGAYCILNAFLLTDNIENILHQFYVMLSVIAGVLWWILALMISESKSTFLESSSEKFSEENSWMNYDLGEIIDFEYCGKVIKVLIFFFATVGLLFGGSWAILYLLDVYGVVDIPTEILNAYSNFWSNLWKNR